MGTPLKAVVGVFDYFDDTVKAASSAKELNCELRIYSPVRNETLEELESAGRSPVRMISLLGAVTGLVGGFALAILCSLDWPLRTSAKDIVSIPAFVVIGYECTILFGALATLAALFHFCRLPDVFRKVGYDPRFSEDKFGVVASCQADSAEEVAEKMRSAGANEVRIQDGL